MNILGTGFAGFIGSALRAVLEADGHKVWTYDRSDGFDILQREQLIAECVDHDIDWIQHLAGVLGTAELFDTPDLAVDVNIQGTLNVLEACKVVGAGYTSISMPQVFPSLYTATKKAAMDLSYVYAREYRIPVSHVVAFNAFGERQAVGPGHPQKIVPHFAVELANGRPAPVWGDGRQAVDLIYVDDLAQDLATSMTETAARAASDHYRYDLAGKMGYEERQGGSGVQHTVLDVAQMTAAALGVPCDVRFLSMRRGEQPVAHLRADVKPTRFRHDDFERTVRWYGERYTGENDPWRS